MLKICAGLQLTVALARAEAHMPNVNDPVTLS
jgi:hypothetical protein